MIAIDDFTVVDWLRAHGVGEMVSGPDERGFAWFVSAPSSLRASASYRVAGDSGRKTSIARAIGSLVEGSPETLVWIDEPGVWPSAQDENLFLRFRQALGEERQFHERRGHVFSSLETADLVSLAALVLYFCWGAVIAPSSGDFIVRFSHDEFLDVYWLGEARPPQLDKLEEVLPPQTD
jgi:hypothetical protein